MHGHFWVFDLTLLLTCALISSAAPFGLCREERKKEGRKEGGHIFRARETAISLLFDAFKAAAIDWRSINWGRERERERERERGGGWAV